MPVAGFLNHTVAIVFLVVGLLSGVLAVVREVQLMYWPAKTTDKRAFWGFARIAFVIALILLWADEHSKVVQLADQKPHQPTIQVNVPPTQVVIQGPAVERAKVGPAPKVPKATKPQPDKPELSGAAPKTEPEPAPPTPGPL